MASGSRQQYGVNGEATTAMANNPKSKDPTQDALNAIEEALKVRDDEHRSPVQPTANSDLTASRAGNASSPAHSAELFPDDQRGGSWNRDDATVASGQ